MASGAASRSRPRPVPQYLAHTAAALDEHGPYAKCNPPLKTEQDVAGLWAGLLDGTIDTVATDHSPFTPADKDPGWDDIWRATPGFPGVDILTPFMIGAALDGKLPLERAVALITSNPADIFGLAPRKGRLLPGADADLVLYDPTVRGTVDTATWQTRSPVAGRVWQGYPLTGRVVTTIVRGTTVYDHGEIVGSPGYGAIIRPEASRRRHRGRELVIDDGYASPPRNPRRALERHRAAHPARGDHRWPARSG